MNKSILSFALAASLIFAECECDSRDYPNYDDFLSRPGADSEYYDNYEYEYEEEHSFADSDVTSESFDTESAFEG
jgi:hypothetical protein